MALWQRGRITLVWSPEHPLHGLEITMRRRTLGEIADVLETGEAGRSAWGDLTPKERAARTVENAADLAGLIASWNFANDDGDPVPHTAEGILAHCDTDLINDVWDAYADATVRVAPPLRKNSSESQPEGLEWEPMESPA